MKILFLHGLDSSRESTKFHAILHPEKFCIDVDYRNLSYASVIDFYHQVHTLTPYFGVKAILFLAATLIILVATYYAVLQILNQHLLQVYSLAANLQQQPKLTTGRAILKV